MRNPTLDLTNVVSMMGWARNKMFATQFWDQPLYPSALNFLSNTKKPKGFFKKWPKAFLPPLCPVVDIKVNEVNCEISVDSSKVMH